jgi:hypothetical protein
LQREDVKEIKLNCKGNFPQSQYHTQIYQIYSDLLFQASPKLHHLSKYHSLKHHLDMKKLDKHESVTAEPEVKPKSIAIIVD